jgi:hypothetical protein
MVAAKNEVCVDKVRAKGCLETKAEQEVISRKNATSVGFIIA